MQIPDEYILARFDAVMAAIFNALSGVISRRRRLLTRAFSDVAALYGLLPFAYARNSRRYRDTFRLGYEGVIADNGFFYWPSCGRYCRGIDEVGAVLSGGGSTRGGNREL